MRTAVSWSMPHSLTDAKGGSGVCHRYPGNWTSSQMTLGWSPFSLYLNTSNEPRKVLLPPVTLMTSFLVHQLLLYPLLYLYPQLL